jgi:protein ImuB
MHACLYIPRRAEVDADASALLAIARDFSPRIEVHAPHLVSLDVTGLGSLLGPPRTIGGELRKTAADRGVYAHVALCASRAAAVILASARAGLLVVDRGTEADALAPLPLRALEAASAFVARDAAPASDPKHTAALLQPLDAFRRWGLKTIGDLAALPAAQVFERTGAIGLAWHAIANGADPLPLVRAVDEERFEQTLELEWPIDGLEPLSFVLGRLFDPLCTHLERRDRGVAALVVRLRLVTRDTWTRRLELPAPIRDARALRTLALLDLESHPPPAAIDVVTVAAEPTPGRVLQYSLLTRALPAAERVSTLLARLAALMGEGRVGSPALVDSYRPGAFDMKPFAIDRAPASTQPLSLGEGGNPDTITSLLRRFRQPIAARVVLEDGRPVRVTTDRRGFGGGRVDQCAGPWRSSGEWWHVGVAAHPSAGAAPQAHPRGEWKSTHRSGYGVRGAIVPAADRPPDPPPGKRGLANTRGAIVPDPATASHDREAQADYIYALNFLVRETPAMLMRERAPEYGPLFPAHAASAPPWHADEWDVMLADGAAYRLARDCDTDRWYLTGILD